MTIKELSQYIWLKEKKDSLEKFKESQYYPYRSPSFERIGSSPLSPGDPTVDAVHRIEKDGWRVDEEIAELGKRIDAIIDWISAIEDPEVSAIMNYHYLQGKTWRDISKLMYNSDAKQTAYSIWARWCREHSDKIADDADLC